MDTNYRLVYFNIRGLAEPIRWMFRIKNVPFEDERVDLKYWNEEKERFSSHAGQLPILYINDSRILTQVHSVTRYIAKQLGFIGQSEMEMTRADQVVEMLYEIRLEAVGHKDCYSTPNPDIVRHTIFRDFANEKSISKKVIMRKRLMEDTLPMYFTKFAEFLEDSGGEYLAGPNLTYADLALANFLDVCEDNINPDILSDFPTLRALKDEVFDIPEIAAWVKESADANTNASGG